MPPAKLTSRAARPDLGFLSPGRVGQSLRRYLVNNHIVKSHFGQPPNIRRDYALHVWQREIRI